MHDPADNAALLAAQHLAAKLFHFHDTRAFAQEAECFAPDAVWYRKGTALRGRAEIVKTLEARPDSLITMHAVSNVVLHEAGPSRAVASFFITTYSHDDGTVHEGPVALRKPPSVGIARTTLLRTGDRWTIAELSTDEWVFSARGAGG